MFTLLVKRAAELAHCSSGTPMPSWPTRPVGGQLIAARRENHSFESEPGHDCTPLQKASQAWAILITRRRLNYS